MSLYMCVCVCVCVCVCLDFPGGSDSKESAWNVGDLGLSLGWEDPLEEGKATYSNLLAWRIPWTEEPGRLAESDMTPWDLKELDITE